MLFAGCLLTGLFLIFVLQRLIFRQGKAYLYQRSEDGTILRELYFAKVKTVSGSENYKIYDTSRPKGSQYIGDIQVINGKGVVRLRPLNVDQDNYVLTDAGEVDENGIVSIYENGQSKKIGKCCDTNGKLRFRDLWLLRNTEVDSEGSNGEYFGRCTESLRFRRSKPNEITLLARTAAVLLLYKPILDSESETRAPANVPWGHLALPAAIIYFGLYAIFYFVIDFHDVFPLLGHILSYVATMILIYFLVIWVLRLITTDMQMNGKPFGNLLCLVDRNTGINGWNIAVITMLSIAFILSIIIGGYELLPLWFVLLIGILLNMRTYTSSSWPIFKPSDGYLNLQDAQGNNYTLDPFGNLSQDDLVVKQYAWGFDSILKGENIQVDKALNFSKKYISYKRKENPFVINNKNAIKNLHLSAKEVIRKSSDSKGDWIIQQILIKVNEIARTKNLSKYDTMQLILSFCQKPNFEWIMDYDCEEINQNHTITDYFRFPIETIYDKRGDCDCTALMGFMLFKKAGVPVAYLLMIGDDGISKHAALAIGISEEDAGSSNGIITIKGKKYYFCETIGENWKVGVLPDLYVKSLQLFEQKLATNPEIVIVSDDY